MTKENDKYVVCMSCGKKYRVLTQNHTLKCGNLTLEEYKEKYPNSETVCNEVKEIRKNNCIKLAKGVKKEKCIKCGKMVEIVKNNRWDVICDECRESTTYVNQSYIEETDMVVCQICWEAFTMITNTHLTNKHNITVAEYKEKYPDARLINKAVEEFKRERFLNENPNNDPDIIQKKKETQTYKYKDIEEKYEWLLKIEQFKDSPDGLMGRCKNHLCKNSKENDGWFVLKKGQFSERVKSLKTGCDGNYFYCCDECKTTCPLYRLNVNDFLKGQKKTKKENPYTHHQYKLFREEVLKRQRDIIGKNECEICGSKLKLHVHHEHPQKTHPHMSIDPDNGIVLCKRCHYKIGHRDNCAIDKISSLVCEKI